MTVTWINSQFKKTRNFKQICYCWCWVDSTFVCIFGQHTQNSMESMIIWVSQLWLDGPQMWPSNWYMKLRDHLWFPYRYILDSSNSSSFWSSKLASSSRSNWTGIWIVNSNGSWTDTHSSHFSTAKEMSLKATFFFM